MLYLMGTFFFPKGKNAGYSTKHDCQVSQPSNATVESSFPSSSVTLPCLVLFWPWNLSTAQAPGNFQHLWWSHEVFTRLVILRCQGSAVAGGQVDGCSPYVPSIKDLAREWEAAKAKGKAHDPNLGKLGVSMIDSCIKDRKYHEISLPVNFVSSFPLAPNAIHPPWHQQWDSLFQLCEGFDWSPKKKAPSPSLGLGSHATLTAH